MADPATAPVTQSTVSLGPCGALWQATLRAAEAGAAMRALAEALALDLPRPGEALRLPDGSRLWRASPRAWRRLFETPATTATALPLDPPEAFAPWTTNQADFCDLGPGLAMISLRGALSRPLLMRAVTLDLREDAFGPQSVAQTGHRGATITVLGTEAGADLLVPRSAARDFADFLGAQAERLS